MRKKNPHPRWKLASGSLITHSLQHMQGGVIKAIKYSELISAFGRYTRNITNGGCCCVPERGILPQKVVLPRKPAGPIPPFPGEMKVRPPRQQISSAPAQPQPTSQAVTAQCFKTWAELFSCKNLLEYIYAVTQMHTQAWWHVLWQHCADAQQ